MQPDALFTESGVVRTERVPLDTRENGILYRLPPADVLCQNRERRIGLPPYIGQVLPVCSGRVAGCLDQWLVAVATARCQHEYGKRNGTYPGQKKRCFRV